MPSFVDFNRLGTGLLFFVLRRFFSRDLYKSLWGYLLTTEKLQTRYLARSFCHEVTDETSGENFFLTMNRVLIKKDIKCDGKGNKEYTGTCVKFLSLEFSYFRTEFD